MCFGCEWFLLTLYQKTKQVKLWQQASRTDLMYLWLEQDGGYTAMRIVE